MARTWKRAGYWLRTCCSCWGSGNSPPLSALAVSSAAEAWALLSLLPAAAREVSTLLVMTARRAATAGVPVSWSSLCLCPGPPRVLVLTVPWSSLCPRCVLVLAVSWSSLCPGPHSAGNAITATPHSAVGTERLPTRRQISDFEVAVLPRL